MKIMNRIVMTVAGLFLIVAGLMKADQIMSEPIVSDGFWESWLFFVIQVPLEIGLGIWLVSGLFRKAAWLLGTLSFFGFIFITAWKWYTGAESCGCFGQVHVDPKITLFTIDIPIFLAMVIFRPKGEKLLPPPWPHPLHCLIVAVPACLFLGAIVPVLWYNRVEPMTPDDVDEFVIEAPVDNGTPKDIEVAPKPSGESAEELDQSANTPDTEDPQTADDQSGTQQQNNDVADSKQGEDDSQDQQSGDSSDVQQSPDAKDDAEEQKNTEQGEADQNTQKAENDAETDPADKNIADQTGQTDQSAQEVTNQAEKGDDTTEKVESPSADQQADEKTSEEQPEPRKVWGTYKYIDEAEKLADGMSIMFFYHHDCPDCRQYVPRYSEKAEEMGLVGQGINFAFVAIPPYKDEETPVPDDTKWIKTKLNQPEKGKWLIGSPWVVITLDGQKMKEWKYTEWEDGQGPSFEQVLDAAFSGQTDQPTEDQPEAQTDDQKNDVEKYLDQTPDN